MAKEPDVQKVRHNLINVLARKPGESRATGWVRGPGGLSTSTVTHKELVGVARQRGMAVNKVTHVRVANVEGEMRVWIYPVDDSDPLRIEFQHQRSKFFVNLSQTLLDWNMTLPTGQRNRYDIVPDEKNESPVGPALYFDMDQPLEIKYDKVKTPRSQTKSPARQAAPGSQPEGPQGAPSTEK